MGDAPGLLLGIGAPRRTARTRLGERFGRDVRWLALRIGLPLGLGVCTYLGRTTRPGALGLLPTSAAVVMHSALSPLVRRAPTIAGCLPDAAWAFALGSTLAFLWTAAARRARHVWLVAGAFLVLGYELAQRPHWVPGTFDVVDLLVSAAAYTAAILFSSRRNQA